MKKSEKIRFILKNSRDELVKLKFKAKKVYFRIFVSFLTKKKKNTRGKISESFWDFLGTTEGENLKKIKNFCFTKKSEFEFSARWSYPGVSQIQVNRIVFQNSV